MAMLRKRPDRPMFIASGGKAGGGAKTNLLSATASIAMLAGLRVGIIDADASATRAITKRMRGTDIPVVPLLDGSKMSSLLDPLSDCDMILFDVGAGELTNERTLLPLLNLANHVGGATGNAAMLVSQIPNKSNIIDDVERTIDTLRDMMEMRIVQQDVDGTGAFDKLTPALQGFPCHKVPHLAPAILNMELPTGWLPADFIRQGVTGYDRLRGTWAAHLYQIAASNAFAQWLSVDGALPILERVARLNARMLPVNLPALRMTDTVVDAWAAVYEAHRGIMCSNTEADILAAALAYRGARASFDRLLA